ncbi:hypothetical protein [Nocardia callitridis]|uniref:Uncharacterized protein n=1 Tax=Nocardia callitridis TaxID=648753 RepID=A0ABP9K1K7_9NOCA
MGIATVCALAVLALEAATFREARGIMVLLTGIPVGLTLLWLIWTLLRRAEPREETYVDDMDNGPADTLRRWQAKSTMLADRAEGTRADWDRHLRPMLAKEFELSSGQRIAKDRKATVAAGIHQFGPELWKWVDPTNSALRDQTTKAPGRAALDTILSRLQEM